MATVTKSCPKCGGALSPAAGDAARLACKACGASFALRSKKPAASVDPENAFADSSDRPEAPKARRASGTAPRAASDRDPRLMMALLIGGGLAVVLLLLFASVGVAAILWYRSAAPPTPVAAAPLNAPATAARPDYASDPSPAKPPAADKPDPPPAPKKPAPPKDEPPPGAPPPLQPAPEPMPAAPDPKPMPGPLPPPDVKPAPAAPLPQDPVNRAIDKAVAYLKTQAGGRAPNNNVPFGAVPVGFGGGWQVGIDGLIGLALLESGVPADDPAIVACTSAVRDGAPTCNQTYEMAISIWFLDRLGDPKDEDLIRDVAARLIAGQQENGKWTYICMGFGLPPGQPVGRGAPGGGNIGLLLAGLRGADMPGDLTADQLKELLETLAKYDPSKEIPAKQRLAPVCNFVKGKRADKGQATELGMDFGMGDLSLTQFAVLGLWVARKHKVPVDRSLLLTEAFVRENQSPDGGWSYPGTAIPGMAGGFGLGTTDSMTCSGMMELAVGRGVAHSEGSKTEAADPQFEKGLIYLADLFTRGVHGGKPQGQPVNAAQVQNLLAVMGNLQALLGPLQVHDALDQHNLWLKDLDALQAEVEKALALDLPDDAKKDLQDLDDQIKKYKGAPAEKKKAALEQAILQVSVLQPGGGLNGFGFVGGFGRLLKPGKYNRMNMDDIYCLWSLERLCMVCDLKTVAGHDWYAWGADLLVDHQNEDGSWSGMLPPPVDTCLALLFLKRVNVAQDLTARLKTVAPIKDLSAEKLKLIAPGDAPSPGVTPKSPGETQPTPPPDRVKDPSKP